MMYALLALASIVTGDLAPDPPGEQTPALNAERQLLGGEAPWRFELSYGRLWSSSEDYWYTRIPAASFVRLEVAAPLRPGHWSWTAGLDVSSDSPIYRSYLISGGITRRSVLFPRWLAADFGGGGGFQFSRYPVQYPLGGGAYEKTTETDGPYFVAHLAGSLALVRLRLGEIVAGVRIEDRPSAWREYWLVASVGVRIALQ